MSTDRIMHFGKYKGTAIKQLILEHIGYIYWCLSNLKWFKLNTEEQALYDSLAIANIKYKINLIFPVYRLAEYIVDKELYKKGITPFFISKNGKIEYYVQYKDNPIIQSVQKYKSNNIHSDSLTMSDIAIINTCLYEPMEDSDELEENDILGRNPHNVIE